MFAKTELTFAENEKKMTDLRDGVRVWSAFFDVKPAVVVPKHDEKEVTGT